MALIFIAISSCFVIFFVLSTKALLASDMLLIFGVCRYLEEPSFSFESYTNLVCNKEVEISKPESKFFLPDEMFLDCELNQEDIEREFGFTFDVPQVELMDAHGNILGCCTNNGSMLPHSDFVNIHHSSTSTSGACDNMMLAESLNFLVSFHLQSFGLDGYCNLHLPNIIITPFMFHYSPFKES